MKISYTIDIMEYLERKVKHCLIYYYITTSLIQSHKKLAKHFSIYSKFNTLWTLLVH